VSTSVTVVNQRNELVLSGEHKYLFRATCKKSNYWNTAPGPKVVDAVSPVFLDGRHQRDNDADSCRRLFRPGKQASAGHRKHRLASRVFDKGPDALRFSLGRDAPKIDLRPLDPTNCHRIRVAFPPGQNATGVTGFNASPTASRGLRWGQGGLNFPDSMRLGETRWDSCRATEPSCHSGYCLEESCRGDAVREPRGLANLASWVTGTEGSNPSLSASFIGLFPI
jgi:hypothetical protein